jgi:hypothetical protein
MNYFADGFLLNFETLMTLHTEAQHKQEKWRIRQLEEK